MNHYWTVNFNSTSSLVGGAVVAGAGENTSIYYNPATISEMKDGSNFSFTSSLFTWNIYSFKDALGDGIKAKTNNFLVQPPFIAFSHRPKNKRKLSLAATVMTRAKEDFQLDYNESAYYNVLTNLPGDEKYNTAFKYHNYYVDTWIGGALAHQVNSKFSYGVSLFVSIATFKYSFEYSATAYSVNDTLDPAEYPQSKRIAQGTYSELIKFTDYRILFKAGLSYKTGSWRFGLNLTTPTIRAFSSGKYGARSYLVSNISVSEHQFLPDFEINDAQEDGQIRTNFKMPFSLSVGVIKDFDNNEKRLYFSAEFFNRINAYKIADAEINEDITKPIIYNALDNKDWLSYAMATKSFVNVALGYSWKINEKLEFLNALRTDFSSIKNADLSSYENYNVIKTSDYNTYHYSAGLKFNIKKNSFIAGGQASFGFENNLKQITNFTHPMEINLDDNRVLQGPLEYNMRVMYWGFNIYIGANLNFLKD
jgi:hypothetical protein